MIELLGYGFFRNALLGLLMLSVTAGILGCYVVTRRLVSITGGITHACFGGLGLGYFLGVPPLWPAALFAVGSALGVQWMGRSGRIREDSAIAVVWAAGMAIGVTFVFLTPGAVPELNSFLFGNVLTITEGALLRLLLFTAALAAYQTIFFKKITICAFDPDFARVSGLNAAAINGIMMVFVAIGIVLMINCVGIMLLMSMLTLPAMVAERFSSRLSTMIPVSVAVSMAGCMAGLLLSSIINVPASAMIVATQVVIYALCHPVAKVKA